MSSKIFNVEFLVGPGGTGPTFFQITLLGLKAYGTSCLGTRHLRPDDRDPEGDQPRIVVCPLETHRFVPPNVQSLDSEASMHFTLH